MNYDILKKCYSFLDLVRFYLDKINYGSNAAKNKLAELGIPEQAITRNSKLKDIHKGKRCFIVGNAPSINKQDLSLLGDEYVFTVNHIYKHPEFPVLKSNYHVFMDLLTFTGETDITSIITSTNKPVCFLSANKGYHYAQETNLESVLDVHYIFNFANMDRYSTVGDITTGITGFYTVIQTAVLIAVYMGFSEIYLIGCDCTGIISNIEIMENKSEISGYSYKMDDSDKQRLKKAYKTTLSAESTFESWTKTFHGYPILNNYCLSNGVKLYNATAGGILDSLPRIKYEDLFVK